MGYHLIRLGIPGPLYWVANPKRWTTTKNDATKWDTEADALEVRARMPLPREERKLVQVKEVTEET